MNGKTRFQKVRQNKFKNTIFRINTATKLHKNKFLVIISEWSKTNIVRRPSGKQARSRKGKKAGKCDKTLGNKNSEQLNVVWIETRALETTWKRFQVKERMKSCSSHGHAHHCSGRNGCTTVWRQPQLRSQFIDKVLTNQSPKSDWSIDKINWIKKLKDTDEKDRIQGRKSIKKVFNHKYWQNAAMWTRWKRKSDWRSNQSGRLKRYTHTQPGEERIRGANGFWPRSVAASLSDGAVVQQKRATSYSETDTSCKKAAAVSPVAVAVGLEFSEETGREDNAWV